ncbi:alpha/beta fold hydrolase [Agarivorans sp. Alg241-V36]|uniref:alpha/beta fold hydrolase n=1 Tax=Agarivorans sp. Alg241-V36 TaxID=2305992 RepID=UPI0013D1792E|nr:alpha/beta hydrolase [Agarivorans sp. Alg241-V36]
MPSAIKQQQQFIQEHLLGNPDIEHYQLETENFTLSVHENGQADEAVMVWIHGTPGSWQDSAYLISEPSLINSIRVVSFDRPGWGLSQYQDQAKPKPVSNMQTQALLISPLIQHLKQQYPKLPLILVGHSWGASLAPIIAEQNPEQIDGLLLLAGGMSQTLTQPRWYNKFADTGVGHFLLSLSDIGKQLNHANLEMFALPDGLADSAVRLSELNIPVVLVQGGKDHLVDPKNADYAEQHLAKPTSKVIRLAKQGHFMQVEQVALISRCTYALASKQLAKC